MATLEFYLERAAQSRREAEEASLTNVRDRCISAAVAWEGMAARLQRSHDYRDSHAAARAERTGHQPEGAPTPTKNDNEENESNEPRGATGAAPQDPPAAH
jgi:hypothetical protein